MLVKGLSRMKAIRMMAIPTEIDSKTYQKLGQGKEDVEVSTELGDYLIKGGYAELVTKASPVKQKKVEKGVKKDG